jgi:hypothetical protein
MKHIMSESFIRLSGDGTSIVYSFSNGFANQAEAMYKWLRHDGFTPSWKDSTNSEGGSETCIALPVREVQRFRQLQKSNPARYGNSPQNANL